MKTKTNHPDYVYVTYINTTPQKLWAALTDPKLIPQYWLSRTSVSTWKKGATVETRDPEGDLEWSGKIVESRWEIGGMIRAIQQRLQCQAGR